MIRFFCSFLMMAVMAGIALCDEPFAKLVADDSDRLTGQVTIEGRELAMQLVDRDQDGDYRGSADRLMIDLDGDGRFHPLRELYAAHRPLRLRGFDAAEHYELLLLENPWRARLIPIQGMGAVKAQLQVLRDDAVISKLEATLVSQSGIHRIIESLNEPIEIPVGSYRLEDVLVEAGDGRYWSIGFSNFDSRLAYSIEVTADQITPCELLGPLKLDAKFSGGAYLKGKLTVQPRFVSETGLTLVRCRVGQREPSDESRLTASLVDLANSEEVIDRRNSGFACGSLCPVAFEAHQAIDPQMNVALRFDIGPLGGVIRHVAPVRLPGYERMGNADDLLELTKRTKDE
ncbi:hypothetical protein NHH03_09640 [Stieleria sp. TO1_6]|nr:hypothetical protein [Stieleria tagensis]